MLEPIKKKKKKKEKHVQGQSRNPSKTVGGVKSHLESSSIPTRHSEGSNKTFAHQETPIEMESDLPLSVSYRGMGQQWSAIWAGDLGAADLGRE